MGAAGAWRDCFLRASLACLALAVPATKQPALAIVGPSEDGSVFAPNVVMVLNRTGRQAGFCTGIVVAPAAVLTAAHCVPQGADIRIHFRDADAKPVLLPVAAVIRHPGYRPDAVRARQRSTDVALIRLAAPLPEGFRPATIATTPATGSVGTSFRLAGFGVTRENDGASSGRLRVATLAMRAPVSSVLLWARDPHGAGACEGDSGGPVFNATGDGVQAIMVWSAGDNRARCGALTQALWLAPLKPWIDETLEHLGARP